MARNIWQNNNPKPSQIPHCLILAMYRQADGGVGPLFFFFCSVRR